MRTGARAPGSKSIAAQVSFPPWLIFFRIRALASINARSHARGGRSTNRPAGSPG